MLDRAKRENPSLSNVDWILGDGTTLAGVGDASADACVSHVVFQHIPDPAITLGYVREMSRVLRPGGWSAFQVSNDPAVHRRPSLKEQTARAIRAATRRAPRGQSARPWRGSAVALDDVHAAAREGGMRVERVVGEGTQFCLVLAVRSGTRDP
jgi:ubiquinone/menaquinone biosynthesis C-methylase UbiE